MNAYNPLIDGHTNPANVASLVSEKLDDSFTQTSPRLRHDGWTPALERVFCENLAETGNVTNAARAAGMSAQSAYTRRNTAAGRAFHLAWEAALILARRRLSDELLSRAMNGCIEAIHRDGVIVAEKHRYDNRLSMAVLTRLDRQTEDSRQDATAARVVADEFEQFLDVLETGSDARVFMAARRPADARRQPGAEEMLLARLENYRKFRVGLAAEIDIADLNAADMESWNEEQIERADLSGMLARLAPDAWPKSVRDGDCAGSHGMSQLHQHHRKLHPAKPVPPRDNFGGRGIWEDDDGQWWTDFPPPPGFDGDEHNEWPHEDYKRAPSDTEQAFIDAELAVVDAEELAEAQAARDRFFALLPEDADEEDGLDEPAEPEPLPLADVPPKAQPCLSSSPSSPD